MILELIFLFDLPELPRHCPQCGPEFTDIDVEVVSKRYFTFTDGKVTEAEGSEDIEILFFCPECDRKYKTT
ncbi:MAG: hypothetical protein GF317_22800 [Candidatus Lokiarchaeota archaeon]|nr:hypothetical protein [Candidatus Lokiarchaeota archaeon]